MSVIEHRDPCEGCDGTCGDVCPVLEAQRLNRERNEASEAARLSHQLAGAVEALRPYLRHAVANCTPSGTDVEDRCVCGLSATLRRLGGQ
jgi:hypothetical protein